MHAIRLIWGISHVPSIHGLRPAKPQSEAFTGLRPAQLQSEAFTGLRPARHFSGRQRAENALRRAHVGSAPAAPIRCASRQPQARAALPPPCSFNTGAFPLRLPALLAVLSGPFSPPPPHPFPTS